MLQLLREPVSAASKFLSDTFIVWVLITILHVCWGCLRLKHQRRVNLTREALTFYLWVRVWILPNDKRARSVLQKGRQLQLSKAEAYSHPLCTQCCSSSQWGQSPLFQRSPAPAHEHRTRKPVWSPPPGEHTWALTDLHLPMLDMNGFCRTGL